mmetsp:Transcript_13867/g.39675  ORF Transcript_13867/g.39675 Transcript_13867/m.39675 type:complete len:263 (+) Transcript_13867:16-804(+)
MYPVARKARKGGNRRAHLTQKLLLAVGNRSQLPAPHHTCTRAACRRWSFDAGTAGAAGAHGRCHTGRLQVLNPALHTLHLASVFPLRVILHLPLLLHLFKCHLAWGLGGRPHQQGGHALDDREEHAANHCIAACRLPTATCSKHAACKEARSDGIPVVVPPSDVLQRAIKGREGPAPDGEVSPEDRRPVPCAVKGASKPVASGGVACAFDEMPDEASNRTHAKRATQVLYNAVGAWLPSRIAIACVPPRHGSQADGFWTRAG